MNLIPMVEPHKSKDCNTYDKFVASSYLLIYRLFSVIYGSRSGPLDTCSVLWIFRMKSIVLPTSWLKCNHNIVEEACQLSILLPPFLPALRFYMLAE